MLTVKATQPNTRFTLALTAAMDAEGNPVPTSLFGFSVPQTDNASAVDIVNYDTETRTGEVSFGRTNEDGSPNVANLTANVLNEAGEVVAPIGVQIAVTHGDVASFEGGFAFDFTTVEEGEGEGEGDGDTETEGETETEGGDGN